MLKVMKSVFLCILLNENYCLKAKLMETKFIYRVMHACIEFKFKMSDRKKSFPAILTTQIDRSSPADFVLHRLWKAPTKGFKTSLILISNITGVSVTFLPWKKKIKLYMKTNFWSFFSLQISMYILNEKIFVLLISQQVKGKTVYYICYH